MDNLAHTISPCLIPHYIIRERVLVVAIVTALHLAALTAWRLQPQSLNINLPKTTVGARDNRPLHVHLAVDAQGRIELDGHVLGDEELADALKQRAADPQFQVQVEADKAVPYGRVAELMAIVQRAGVAKLSFITIAAH